MFFRLYSGSLEGKHLCGKVGWWRKGLFARPPFFRLCKVAGIGLFLCLLMHFAMAMLLPEASNTVVYKKGGALVDASHSDQGYVMVKRQSKKAQKMRISLGKAVMTYNLNNAGEFEVFPLQLGDGKYKVEVFEQVKGDKYSPAASMSFSAKIADDSFPFLYPNQYVWYDASTEAVAKANELCANAASDADKVEAVYRYMLKNMMYDYIFAAQVASGQGKGYIPSVDKTLKTNTGVCFDFSALIACMLRSQGVATQLVIGYADKAYHAWNNVLVDGTWYQYDVTMEICQGSVKAYTTERVY